MRTLLSGILLCTGALCIRAQENTVQPFRSLSVGIGTSLNGLDIEFGTRLHKNFQLRGGISVAMPFWVIPKIPLDIDYGDYMTSQKWDKMAKKYPDLVSDLKQEGLPSNIEEVSHYKSLKLKTIYGDVLGRILVDYYPWSKKSSFHVTIGFFAGGRNVVKQRGNIDPVVIRTIDKINNYPELDEDDKFSPSVTINGTDIYVNELNGHVDASLKINSFKPYLGIGFGRAVPNKRVGVQFDLGVWYHGKWKISSSNPQVEKALDEGEDDDKGLMYNLDKIKFLPRIALKIVGRIF